MDSSTLIQLYNSGKSMKEMADILGCSVHKISYWMSKHGHNRRTRSEATYIKLNPTGDPFKIKLDLSMDEAILYGVGIGIYWGEGDKNSPTAVRVTNTDPYLLRTFIQFLLVVCQLERRKLLYSIVCFNDSNVEEVRRYWQQELEIIPDKFGKIVQIPQQGKGTYKRKSKFGVCSVTVSNPKLKKWIMAEIKQLPR